MNQSKLQLTGANYNGSRRELDYYPTPYEVTVSLMEFLSLKKDCHVWEPACGDGYMIAVIEKYVDTVIGSDIRDTKKYEKADYLKCKKNGIGAIITNPPFFLADDFIRKAVNEAPIVAMLLKSQFWHAKKRTKLFMELPPSYVCPLTWRPDFLFHERVNGEKGNPTMEVCWNVWFKGDRLTKYFPMNKIINND